MKHIQASVAVLVLVAMGYGAGFIDSPSGLPSYTAYVTPANYGAGFIGSPTFTPWPAYYSPRRVYTRPYIYQNAYQPFYYYGYLTFY